MGEGKMVNMRSRRCLVRVVVDGLPRQEITDMRYMYCTMV
jgi:hypothetical protein